MIIVGVDYHPSVQQVAFLDTETGERRAPLRITLDGMPHRIAQCVRCRAKTRYGSTPRCDHRNT
jgi:hypothetical protein